MEKSPFPMGKGGNLLNPQREHGLATPQIIIATKNRHKYDEITAILAGIDCQFIFAGDIPDLPDVIENEQTLLDNALLKAKQTAHFLQKPCLADDTGFFVRALDDRPGIYAARYAGEGCTYADNVQKLLNELSIVGAGFQPARVDRYAYFMTVTVLYCPIHSFIATGVGKITGQVIDKPQGTDGFGYDPIFVPDGYDLTFAQMPAELKNKISHRSLSVRNIYKQIQYYINVGTAFMPSET